MVATRKEWMVMSGFLPSYIWRRGHPLPFPGFHHTRLFPSALGKIYPYATSSEKDVAAAKAMLTNADLTVADVCEQLKTTPATLYRYLPEGGRPALVEEGAV